MGFISVILTIIFVMWILGIIARIFLRSWLLRQQRKFAQAQSSGAYSRSSSSGRDSRPEGSVKVETPKGATTQKQVSSSVGDYVDFEEQVD